MLSKMKLEETLPVMALLWGVTNSLDKVVAGKSIIEILVVFLGSVLIGTLFTLVIAWVVLAVIRKRHLLFAVTNWTMLIFSCLNVPVVSAQLQTSG